MNEQAEFTPAVIEVESETQDAAALDASVENFQIPEASSEALGDVSSEVPADVSESASRAAAMLALNETAAQNDWSQDRLAAAQANLGGKTENTVENVETPAAIEAPETVEAPHADSLTAAVQEVHTKRDEERSHAAALAALDQEKKRAELLSLEDTAAHQDWTEDRLEAAKAQVEAKYS